MSKDHTILALWSGPRNLSTALMYSFAQRSDCRVLDEPLFGHFLKYTGVWRPSRVEALRVMETNATALLSKFAKPSDMPLLFIKNMANHTEGIALKEILGFRNIILTRHPAKVLSSYTKQVEQPTILDLCYQHQLQILDFLQKKNQKFWVVDSDRILENPPETLEVLCQALQIPFQPAMLRWEAGPRPEDGVWARYWYHNVHKSTGFAAPAPERASDIPEHLQDLYNESLDLYHQIKQYEQIQSSRSTK